MTTRQTARQQMMHELEALQDDLMDNWLDKSLPEDWTGLEIQNPVPCHKTRVTIRLDSDMVRWFRKLGPGYGARMNRVLRIYWMALVAGHIQAYQGDNVMPRMKAEAHRLLTEIHGDDWG